MECSLNVTLYIFMTYPSYKIISLRDGIISEADCIQYICI